MKKFVLTILVLTLCSMSPEIVNSSRASVIQNGSITGVVIARERANGDLSLGVAAGLKSDSKIDKMEFTLPFKPRKDRVAFVTDGWNVRRKGVKIMLKRNNDANGNAAEGDPLVEVVNFRIEIGAGFKPGILKTFGLIEFRVDKSTGTETGSIKVKSFPEKYFGLDGIRFPGRIAPGEKVFGSVADPVESAVLKELYPNGLDESELKRLAAIYRAFFKIYLGERTLLSGVEYRLKSDTPVLFYAIQISLLIPPQINPEEAIGFWYRNRWGETFLKAEPVVDIKIALDKNDDCKFSLDGCTQYVFDQQVLCACGCFDTEYGRSYLLEGFKIDGKPRLPDAASKTTAMFIIEGLKPGLHTIEYIPRNGRGYDQFFRVIKIDGAIDQSELWTGQLTQMRLQVSGTEDKLPFEVTNKTPEIIRIEGGDKQMIKTSGGPNNLITRGVNGIRRGNFDIDYKLSSPKCPCNEK